MRNVRMGLVTGCLVAFGLGSLAVATERHVPSQYPTIQAAVYACVDGDVVTVAPGVYTGTGNKNIYCQNRAITIRSTGGPASCVIDCEHDGYAFRIESSYNDVGTALNGFTMRNGQAGYAGVGFFCQAGHGSSVTIMNCDFLNNTANEGGGLHLSQNLSEGNSVRLKNCRFLGNQAEKGAGIYCRPGMSVSLVNCRFIGNSATLMGGAVYGYCNMVNCLLADNTAGFYGGAVCGEGTGMTANLTTIVGNTAGWYGGGVYVFDGGGGLQNTIVALNSAPYGSQIALEYTTVFAVWASNIYGVQPIYLSGASYMDWESGNINADPQFVDATTGDYHLLSGSPCVDAGDNALIGNDELDLDGDGITSEELPYDIENGHRIEDDPNTPNEWMVDMGAYEWSPYPIGDVNYDGFVNFGDINPFVLAITNPSLYQQTYGYACPRNRDINGDGIFNFADINPFVMLLVGGN